MSASWFTHIPATLHHSRQAPPSFASHSNSSYILQESPPHPCLFRKAFTLQPNNTSNLILLIPFSPPKVINPMRIPVRQGSNEISQQTTKSLKYASVNWNTSFFPPCETKQCCSFQPLQQAMCQSSALCHPSEGMHRAQGYLHSRREKIRFSHQPLVSFTQGKFGFGVYFSIFSWQITHGQQQCRCGIYSSPTFSVLIRPNL